RFDSVGVLDGTVCGDGETRDETSQRHTYALRHLFEVFCALDHPVHALLKRLHLLLAALQTSLKLLALQLKERVQFAYFESHCCHLTPTSPSRIARLRPCLR